MTDKQIIIDGVDVSECLYFCDGYCNDHNDGFKCNLNSEHCYYKQLKRKEQECEELKETFDDLFKVQYKLADTNKKLRQCLTEIKEFFNEECIICKENYINITGEICEECKYKDILQKISEVEDEHNR